MSYMDNNEFSTKYINVHRVLYILVFMIVLLTHILNITDDINQVILLCITLVVFLVTDTILNYLSYFNNSSVFVIFRFIEIVIYGIMGVFVFANNIVYITMLVFRFVLSAEFILCTSEFDSYNMFIRKILASVPIVLNAVLSFGKRSESVWLCVLLVDALLFIVLCYVVDWFSMEYKKFDKENKKLYIEKSNMEATNAKLVEYQERVKTINEQINYQKIDLARAYKELEQANIEIESQTEVMKYMASTFDVLKCVNVITDAIMEVKKPKLCALYIDKDVYMNKYGSCIIKTNYTSLQRRLKKDIELIFEDVAKNLKRSEIKTLEEIKKYRFVGYANINTLAVLPLYDNDKIYGVMIVGSDKEDFFSKGLNYYETCIVEFTVALKSANMFLRMEDIARKDGLTGLYNRLHFNELFKKASMRATSKNEPLSVALFDIDKFKSVNDTYGHLAGDMVIKMIASVGQKYAERYGGFACRYGGEEFLLILPNIDEEYALIILEKMHEEIKSTTVSFEDINLNVNVCIGIASYPNTCEDVRLLVSRADKAMYYGKNNGRGRLVLDNPTIE